MDKSCCNCSAKDHSTTTTYYFDHTKKSNHEELTAAEKAVLRTKLSEFNKYGIHDLIKIVKKHEKDIKLSISTFENLFDRLDTLRPVTLREMITYVKTTTGKRKPLIITAERMKPKVKRLGSYRFDATDPVNNIPLTSDEKTDLQDEISKLTRSGVLDVTKIIEKHQSFMNVKKWTAKTILLNFDYLVPVTLHELKAYVKWSVRKVPG